MGEARMLDKMIDAQRQLVAGKVMGWLLCERLIHREFTDEYILYWCKEDQPLMRQSAWYPDMDIHQAMMVAEALRQLGWRVRLTSVPSWNDEPAPHEFEAVWFGKGKSEFRSGAFPYGRSYDHRAVRPETAIFAVAVQIAERMETDDSHKS